MCRISSTEYSVLTLWMEWTCGWVKRFYISMALDGALALRLVSSTRGAEAAGDIKNLVNRVLRYGCWNLSKYGVQHRGILEKTLLTFGDSISHGI